MEHILDATNVTESIVEQIILRDWYKIPAIGMYLILFSSFNGWIMSLLRARPLPLDPMGGIVTWTLVPRVGILKWTMEY
jgi:hypothetical protein